MLTITEPKTAILNLFSKLSLQPHNEIFQNWVSGAGKSAITKMKNVIFFGSTHNGKSENFRAKCLFSVVCYQTYKQTSEMNVFGTEHLNTLETNFFCIITTAKQNTLFCTVFTTTQPAISILNVWFFYYVHTWKKNFGM